MPSKSKRNRRPQTRRIITNSVGSNIENTKETLGTTLVTSPEVKKTVSFTRNSKTDSVEALVGNYFSTEVKWIGLVTAIIIILLIVSYYIFR